MLGWNGFAVRCGLCRSLRKQDRASRLLLWHTDAGIAIGNRRGTEVLAPSPQGVVWIYPLLRTSTERFFSPLYPYPTRQLVWSPLRASSDHRFIVGALRAQRPCQLSRHFPSKLARSSPWGTAWLVSHCARPTRAFRGRALREHRTLTRQPPSYVSIISNRASNSCPQAVQRMQSDSTVNSSDLIPMPPQSGQRASWTL
jgi:hypothetical protein